MPMKNTFNEPINPILSHVDTPTSYPRATLFKVSGWVATDADIVSIYVGSKAMEFVDRPDVKKAHPDYANTTGFDGLARELELNENEIVITITTDSESIEQRHALSADFMFDLSKREKLEKFSNSFPDSDSQDCIKNSVAVEVAHDTIEKIDALTSIVKCPVCQSVGAIKSDDGFRCEQNHSFHMVGNAFTFLTSEIKAQHNIGNNIDAASRAQDPLAVALIGKLKDGLILDCGAGLPFQNYRNVINFEIEKFTNTDVIGVGEELPFGDETFDAVFSFSVLEHVKDPFKCAAEIKRVLKPNGILYCSVPFLIPVHGYPHHYYNMTSQGLDNLFSDQITIVESGVPSSGHPFFTLNAVANIWLNELPKEHKDRFKNMTIGEILDAPEIIINEPVCQSLPQQTQADISCTNMILGRKA